MKREQWIIMETESNYNFTRKFASKMCSVCVDYIFLPITIWLIDMEYELNPVEIDADV